MNNDWKNHTKILTVDIPAGKIIDIFNFMFSLICKNFIINILLKIIHMP